jgi:hypothetical protein
VINNKDYGGDKESGLADDGIFTKTSAGIVYRPIPTVASWTAAFTARSSMVRP